MKQLYRIKEKLAAGLPVIGTHIKSPDPTITEFFALRKVDFVWLDGEHVGLSFDVVLRHTLAAQGLGTAVFYRLPNNDPVLAKPILDMGVDGIIFPMVCTREEAERAVAACLYPPAGIRGMGPIRDNGYGLLSNEEQLKNAGEVWKIMQIEHRDAVDNLDEILSVPGVDAITVGMSDLSASLGIPGQVTHPEVVSRLDIIAAKCRERGVPFSVSCLYNRDIIQQWLDRGANWLSVGGEYSYMDVGFRQATDEMLEMWNRRAEG